MSDTFKIPMLAFEEVTAGELVKRARNLIKIREPKFQLWELATTETFSAQLRPAVIIGLSARDGGWFYDIVAPGPQGQPQRENVREDRLSKLSEVADV